MAQAMQAAGGRFLDAPMTGTPKEAAEGRPVLAHDPSGLKFSLANAVKDLSCYGEMAAAAGAQRQVAEAVLAALKGAVEAGGAQGGEKWVPEIVGVWGTG